MKLSERMLKHLTAGFVCLVALIVYFLTMAPTVSFWDCGEFVACANTLGIPHPPGTPFFVFLGRAIIILLPFIEEVAARVNIISVVSSAATVYVASLFAFDFLAKILSKDSLKEKLGNFRKPALITAGLVAGFLLTFSDTFWFNAVEAEVYGLAMFILVLISYLGLVWYDNRENESKADRYLIFICYIAFLGVGAHLYTMLTIPAVFVLLLIAEPKKIVDRIPVWITGIILCSVIYYVSNFILWSVIALIVLTIFTVFSKSFKKPLAHAIKLSLAFTFFALVGYSTHLYIPIRSELNPVIDENDPEINWRDDQGNLQLGNLFKGENWESFNAFIERKQYGSESMIARAFYRRANIAHQFLSFPHMGYGGYQIAQYLPFKVGEVNFYNGFYSFDSSENQPLEKFGIKFPTQMAAMGDNYFVQFVWFLLFNGLLVAVCVYAYRRQKKYGIFLSVLYALCSLGLLFYINFADGTRLEKRDYEYWTQTINRTIQDLNASGIKISGSVDPNKLIDAKQAIANAEMRLEYAHSTQDAQKIASAEQNLKQAKENPTWKTWRIIESAYASAGQIAPFPEAVHLEVRERDYFYTPAFIFMSIMFGIGAGILVWLLAAKASLFALPLAALLVLVSFAVPCFSNYKEHDRSGLYVPWDYAYNLLNSCRPNAILFTNGDNDTFPLWFAQEVAGIRKDVRVVNLSLGNTDWYIKQMLVNEPILKLSYDNESIDRDMVLEGDYRGNPKHFMSYWLKIAEAKVPQLKARIQEMEADSASNKNMIFALKSHYVVWDAFIDFVKRNGNGLMLTQHKLVLDLALQNLDKPLHFSTTVGSSNFLGLEKYMVQEGMVYNLIRDDITPKNGRFDKERTMLMVDSIYKYRGLGDGTAYINDETSRLLSSYISLYLQIAFNIRDEIFELQKQPYTQTNKNAIDSLCVLAMKYLDKGMYQFKEEWRSYWVAGIIYQTAFQKENAIQVLEKGLKAVPEYETSGRERLKRALEESKLLPDAKQIVPEVIENPDSANSDSVAKNLSEK